MRRWTGWAAGVLLFTAGCTSTMTEPSVPVSSQPATSGEPLVSSPLVVGPGLGAAPLDQPRQVLAPEGWSVSVWARLPAARLAAWGPDGTLLVSRPKTGDVMALTP